MVLHRLLGVSRSEELLDYSRLGLEIALQFLRTLEFLLGLGKPEPFFLDEGFHVGAV